MKIQIQRRAEIALRSLGKREQDQILRALSTLSQVDSSQLGTVPSLHKLVTGYSDKKLYTYKGTKKLMLILSIKGDTCTVEDIVSHDRFDRLITQR